RRTHYWPEPAEPETDPEAAWHHRLVWREIDRPDPPAEPAPWLLFVPAEDPDGAMVRALRAALTEAGAPEPRPVPIGAREQAGELADRLRGLAGTEYAALVSLLAFGPRDTVAGLPGATAATATLVRALDEAGIAGPWWWLTEGAIAAGPEESPDAAAAQLWGLGLGVSLDHPDRWGGLLDLGTGEPAELGAAIAAISGDTGEDQLAVRGSRLCARRLVAGRPVDARLPWRTTGTALITGGTGALGGHVARWLAGAGAEHLLLLSRSGPDAPGADGLVAELAGLGVTAEVVSCDLTAPSGRDTVAELRAGHDIRTVVHTAGVVGGEAPLARRDLDTIAATVTAKVDGAELLDELFADTELDAFVLFSSGAATWGNAGQADYAAANAHLDALATRRAAAGRSALAVAWGAWAGGGMVDTETASALRERGVREMRPERAVAAMERLLAAGSGPTAVISDMEWDRFADVYTASRARKLLEDHERVRARARRPVAETTEPQDRSAAFRDRLASAASETERSRIAVDLVRRTAAAALGHDNHAAVGAGRSFLDLGFESVTAVDFRNRIATATGIRLDATVAYDHPTPRALAAHLLERTGPVAATGTVEQALAALESAMERTEGSRTGELAERLRGLADRLTEPATAESGEPVDEDLAEASDEEIFDLIDKEFGAA
ncbi:type I polyketide synthase, partial [Sciscionella sediminilitoris]|uniref:type I polyketide synthase n=1 Tax=Sciscionella sediminilitoris TaxID=1445613 RepID=UPI0012E2B11F